MVLASHHQKNNLGLSIKFELEDWSLFGSLARRQLSSFVNIRTNSQKSSRFWTKEATIWPAIRTSLTHADARVKEVKPWLKLKGVRDLEPVSLFSENLAKVQSDNQESYCEEHPSPRSSETIARYLSTLEPALCFGRQATLIHPQSQVHNQIPRWTSYLILRRHRTVMRNYSIYACTVTIRIVVCFAILAFAFKFDFPPFMVLIIALLNDGTIKTLSADRILPSMTPDSWDSLSVALVTIILETMFFYDKFGVTFNGNPSPSGSNDYQLHMIVYLQVAIISQALTLVTRSHGFFFMERPSVALFGVFCVAQLVSSIIAAYANFGFTQIQAISGGWIGIVWVWNIVWFAPLDWIKFAMKATVIKKLRQHHEAAQAAQAITGVPITCTQSHAASIHES
ncbi:uncharacterized protein HD556DRAFT_1458269 [Suillus plorans]|uniref:Exoribonuclease Xrn1 D2/D3 domain-containing protein n=1 Tax=Suillus plorans TaxID=116603 RepID=A0A9P7DNV4_9AGAM|nr:uncharacterized protein HD556DRAFT_1458269 [Suillus plorans]KAG1799421.1 hypothetical protein HD556DRAFT_1458269 [Suillus plorans]